MLSHSYRSSKRTQRSKIRSSLYYALLIASVVFLSYLVAIWIGDPLKGPIGAFILAFVGGPFLWGALLILKPEPSFDTCGKLVIRRCLLTWLPAFFFLSILLYDGLLQDSEGYSSAVVLGFFWLISLVKLIDFRPKLIVTREEIRVRVCSSYFQIRAVDISMVYPFIEWKYYGKGSWDSMRVALKQERASEYINALETLKKRHFLCFPPVDIAPNQIAPIIDQYLAKTTKSTTRPSKVKFQSSPQPIDEIRFSNLQLGLTPRLVKEIEEVLTGKAGR